MVLDTSAVIAILGNENERRAFNERIAASNATLISAANLLEARIVLFARSGENAVLALDAFILKSGIEVCDVTPEIGDLAFAAYRRFGKGMGHRAGLNFGDCLAYALAKHRKAPLLFKGEDFAKTDIASALS